MRPVLQNQPQIGSLGQFLLESLRHMLASITTGWSQQHNGDGGHTDITASGGASITGTTVLGKVNLRSAIYNHDGSPSVHNLTVDTLAQVSWLRIFPAGPMSITGIDATGRETGDLLLVTNCGSSGAPVDDIELALADAGSLSANRFSQGGTAPPTSPFTLYTARGVWLVYDYDVNSISGPRVPAWRIIDQA
jgi:hypothetical protein